jgi:lipopolysaccharide export system permease protein
MPSAPSALLGVHPVKIIGKYVLKEHAGPFVFASTALTSLMLLQYVAKRFGELVGKGLPTSVIVEFLLLSVPFTVAMTLPMAVLVAVLYAFSRLASENEITAMKASGLSMRSVLAPVVLGGLAMSGVMLFFNDQVLPRANHRLAVLQMDIFRTKPTFALREQVINPVKEGQLYLKAGDIDEGTSRMTDVVIYDLGNPARRRTIIADSGRLMLASNGTDLNMLLYDGVMMEVPNNNTAELTRMFFEEDRLRVRNVVSSYQESQTGTVTKGDREMSVCEMHRAMASAEFRMRQAEFELANAVHEFQGGPKPDPLEYRDPGGISGAYCGLLSLVTVRKAEAQETPARGRRPLRSATPPAGQAATEGRVISDMEMDARRQEYRYRREEARRDRDRYDVEIHKKFSLAAACIIFVLVGAPIALRYPRGGVGLVIGVSFAIFGLYYVGLIGGETLANKGYLPPWFAMWAANLVLLVLGLALVARMGNESSTARGGDMGELLTNLRARWLGWLRRFGVSVERRHS